MARRIMVLPDIHFPVHDEEALEVVLAACRYFDPHEVVQLGDMLDCGDTSSHGRKMLTEARGTYISDEIIPAQTFLDRIQHRGGARSDRLLTLLEGNHEYRVQRWCLELGPMGGDVYRAIAPEHLLTQRQNVEWIPYMDDATGYQRYHIAPNLVAVHGWSHAKKAADVHMEKSRYQYSVVFGHVHRDAKADSVQMNCGEYRYAWSPGMLCKKTPLYMHDKGPNNWHCGFTVIHQSESNPRKWSHYPITIANGECVMPDGKEIRV